MSDTAHGLPPSRHLALALLGAPAAWSVHFLAAYVVVALWCSAGWRGAGVALAVLTILCVAAAVAAGLLAVRVWQRGRAWLARDEEPGEPGPWDARMGERGARAAFVGVVALFMAGLFTFLILLEALPVLFAPLCPPATYP